MSQVLYPIVKLADPVARERLIKDLMDMGFGRRGTRDMATAKENGLPDPDDWPHIAITASSISFHIIGLDTWEDHRYTLVNSPRHMLAYIRSMRIKP